MEEIDKISNHLMTGEGQAGACVLNPGPGSVLLEESERKKSYIRARPVEGNDTPEDFIGIAIIIDACTKGRTWIVSSYERHLFSHEDDILTARDYALFPIGRGYFKEMKEGLLDEYGFREADTDDDASVEEVEDMSITELLPDDDD